MYKKVIDTPGNVWLNTETGVSFGEHENNEEYRKFKQWVKDGGEPEEDLMVLPKLESKQTRGNLLSLHIKQAIEDAKIQTPEAQKLANILQQLADGVADLQRDKETAV